MRYYPMSQEWIVEPHRQLTELYVLRERNPNLIPLDIFEDMRAALCEAIDEEHTR